MQVKYAQLISGQSIESSENTLIFENLLEFVILKVIEHKGQCFCSTRLYVLYRYVVKAFKE